MRTAREFDPSKKLYAKKSIKYSGRLYNRGDEFPSRDVTNKKLLKLFQNGFLGHSEDFRDNKSTIKEVELKVTEPETPEQKPSEETEVKSEEPVQQEESKPQKKTRRKYTKKSDTSSD